MSFATLICILLVMESTNAKLVLCMNSVVIYMTHCPILWKLQRWSVPKLKVQRSVKKGPNLLELKRQHNWLILETYMIFPFQDYGGKEKEVLVNLKTKRNGENISLCSYKNVWSKKILWHLVYKINVALLLTNTRSSSTLLFGIRFCNMIMW